MKIELLVSDKMIRNEDYEASAPPPSYNEVTSDLKFSINTEESSVKIEDTKLEAGLVFRVSQDWITFA